MGSRRRSRELAVQFAYQFTLKPDSLLDNGSIDRFWKEQAQTTDNVRPFFEELVMGVATRLPTIDETIKESLVNWRMDRLEKMDFAILRVGCFEIIEKLTPPPVVINELVELSKRYCNPDSPKFINGTLDAIRKKFSENNS